MAIVHPSGFRTRIYEESPWYWPIAGSLARFDALSRFPTPEELSALYEERAPSRGARPLRFVTQARTKKRREKSAIVLGELYEGRVVERAEVPTRSDDWHDLFNALAFVTFPHAKLALHARQYGCIRARLAPGATRLPNARTREQDALSLFDEGGVCVAAPPELVATLCADAEEALTHPELRARVCVVPFGHALYEHLVAGLPCPLGALHVVALEGALDASLDASPELLSRVDLALARSLADPAHFQRPNPARGRSLTSLLPAMQ